MKIILNRTSQQITWQGTDYRVLGQPGIVEEPLVLLDCINSPAPDYNPETQALDYTPHSEIDGQWIDSWEVRNLTPGELAPKQAYAAAAAAFESLSPGKQALWEPVRVKVASLILASDFAGAAAVLQTMPVIYTGAEADRDMFLALFAEP